MSKPTQYVLEWSPPCTSWRLVSENVIIFEVDLPFTKQRAISRAARYCRDLWEEQGEASQLRIRNKNGRYAKGRNGERSYGCDSRRRSG